MREKSKKRSEICFFIFRFGGIHKERVISFFDCLNRQIVKNVIFMETENQMYPVPDSTESAKIKRRTNIAVYSPKTQKN